MNDVALLITVYPPYAGFLPETLAALERYWPEHPALVVGPSAIHAFAARILADLRTIATEFVVVMHEDLRICGPVRHREFLRCLEVMRADRSLVSCSLTWEPSDIGRNHFPKTPYGDDPRFQVISSEWEYAVNFQARIWRRTALRRILERLPPQTSNRNLEPLASAILRLLFPNRRVITYAIPDPERPSLFVDCTDKSAWIVPFDNLVHAGRQNPTYDTAYKLE